MSIIVDTSVWIDYFNGNIKKETDALDNELNLGNVAIGDLILLEILQGFRLDKEYKIAKDSLNVLNIYSMLSPTNAIEYAENYRILRKKGITIRKTADIIIASFCIKNNYPLLFSDRGFIPFVENLGLESAI